MSDERVSELVDHLFRREAGRLVAALTGVFGLSNLNLCEDVVQETLGRALELWPYHGVPENPAGWLWRAARNLAIDRIRRETRFRKLVPELAVLMEMEWTRAKAEREFLPEPEIPDDQLRLMFSCCDPALSQVSQVSLILHTLGGFGVDEVAQAFLSDHAAMERRLGRARRRLKKSGSLYDLSKPPPPAERLDAVHQAIYLLFNEGYHASFSDEPVRRDLCAEALRLGGLLAGDRRLAAPATHALQALMCLHAARLAARVGEDGCVIQLENQDRARWDGGLIAEGLRRLDLSAAGAELTAYHLEAAIAAQHALAPSYERTDWAEVLRLYGLLAERSPFSPVVALNRAIAAGQAEGPERALAELGKLAAMRPLKKYPFYWAALGEFSRRAGAEDAARAHYAKALELGRNRAEKEFFGRKLEAT